MGNSTTKEIYIPKYDPKDYTKVLPGKNIYKIHKNKVYWRGKIVEGANGNQFFDTGKGYGKDDKHIFFKGFKVINQPDLIN